MATEEQIRELAYNIWEQEGRPDGKDQEHYYSAKRMLEEREAAMAPTSQLQSASPLLPQPASTNPSRRGRRG
ncbi:MAG: DUF2934 domain-containing protein [Chloroflexi bacterium]|nr:DUF2934 domain-containing protein [Chloroflexota bacterium]